MVFIDTIRFLQLENLPVLATATDLRSQILAFQLQNGKIYLISVSKIYEWEDNLKESILRKEYTNPRSLESSSILGSFTPHHSISSMQFSQKSFVYTQIASNPNQKNVVPIMKSKDNPNKKIKITILSKEPTSGHSASVECSFLALGTQEGLLYIIATKLFNPESSKELPVVIKMYPSFQLPINSLCWHEDILVIGFLDNTVKLYSLVPSSDSSNYSLKFLNIFQNSQLPWKMEALTDTLAIYNRFECNFIDFTLKEEMKMITFKCSQQDVIEATQTTVINSQIPEKALELQENLEIKKDDEFFWMLMMTRASRVGTSDGKYTVIVTEKDATVPSQKEIVKKLDFNEKKTKKKKVAPKSRREEIKESSDHDDESEDIEHDPLEEEIELPPINMSKQNLSIILIEELNAVVNYPLENYALGWGFSPFLYFTTECSARISEACNSKKLDEFMKNQKELTKSYRYVIVFVSELQIWEFVPKNGELKKGKSERKETKPEATKLLVKIRKVYKSYVEFCWIDPYRLLLLDDKGRVDFYSFSSEEVGLPCESF